MIIMKHTIDIKSIGYCFYDISIGDIGIKIKNAFDEDLFFTELPHSISSRYKMEFEEAYNTATEYQRWVSEKIIKQWNG